MKRSYTLILACVMSLLCIVGCDVHEFPEDRGNLVPFTLRLNFETEMPLYKEITYTRAGSEDMAKIPQHDIRYIIQAYRIDNNRSDTRIVDTTYIFTKADITNLDYTARFDISEGTYTFRVWADYVNAGSESDKYYNTSDFAEIILSDRNNHPGSNDFRDAFRGETTATVIDATYYTSSVADNISNEAEVEMKRPMGKFQVISTDVQIFITRLEEMMKESGIIVGQETPLGQSAYEQTLQKVKWSDYQVVMRYNMFMPCSYNMFTDKPADTWTGVSFTSELELLSENEMQMGFDYIFVNGKETTISITIELHDSDGKLLSTSNPIDVPITRSRLTVIKGEFLTSEASGGVSISTGYEDDYNIEIL